MTTPQDLALERLQAAVIDGRPENGRYRQDQLQALHGALRSQASALTAALAHDARASAAEAEAEFLLGMDAVRHFYDSIDFGRELEDEYRVANGKDHPGRRLGVGVVVIRPTSHTRFYSVVCPLAAAVAAGNAVVLELHDTLLETDAILRTTLTDALDANTFFISKGLRSDDPIASSLLSSAVLVDQTGTSSPLATPAPQVLLSSSTHARAIAVVDRTANIDLAARAIATARFGFGGTSPYAPDLVLVNEFVKKEFFEACSRHATLAFARESQASGARKVSANADEETRRAVVEAEEKRLVAGFGSSEFKLVDVLDKDAPIARMKISGRYLLIATVSGLVDSIFTHPFEKPLLAGYFFAEPRAAKYLSQFLDCHISTINQIPAHLLVGPAAPLAHPPSFPYRYSRDMFSTPRPQFVEPPAPQGAFAKVADLLQGQSSSSAAKGSVTTAAVRALAVEPLRPTGQKPYPITGFFESGFLIGASITLSIVLPLVGWTTYLAGRKGLELAWRLRR